MLVYTGVYSCVLVYICVFWCIPVYTDVYWYIFVCTCVSKYYSVSCGYYTILHVHIHCVYTCMYTGVQESNPGNMVLNHAISWEVLHIISHK